MKQPRLVALVLAVAAGCGGGSPSPSPSPPATMPTPSSTPPPPDAGGVTHAVTVGPNGSMMFAPQSLSIAAGDTVMWQWPSGSLPHTVTSGVPGAPDGKFCSLQNGEQPSVQACSGAGYAMSGPASYSFTFASAGTFPYFCQVHGAMMTGTVSVGP